MSLTSYFRQTDLEFNEVQLCSAVMILITGLQEFVNWSQWIAWRHLAQCPKLIWANRQLTQSGRCTELSELMLKCFWSEHGALLTPHHTHDKQAGTASKVSSDGGWVLKARSQSLNIYLINYKPESEYLQKSNHDAVWPNGQVNGQSKWAPK